MPDLGRVVKTVQSRPYDSLSLLLQNPGKFVGQDRLARCTQAVNPHAYGVG